MMTGRELAQWYGVSLDVAQALERVLGAEGIAEIDRWAMAIREVDESVGERGKPPLLALLEAQCYTGQRWRAQWGRACLAFRNANESTGLARLGRLLCIRAAYARIAGRRGAQ